MTLLDGCKLASLAGELEIRAPRAIAGCEAAA